MSEPMSDALFGVDGTELPELFPDPSGRGGWEDVPALPPLPLLPVSDDSALREAIAAVLGGDPPESVDRDSGVAPASEPAARQNVTQPNAPQTKAPEARGSQSDTTAPQPTTSAPQGAGIRSAVTSPSHHPSRPLIPSPVVPAQAPPRKPGRPSFRPPLAAAGRVPVRLGDLRRRVGRQGVGLPRPSWSNGGAGAVLVTGFIIIVVLLYGVIAGIVESIARLLP